MKLTLTKVAVICPLLLALAACGSDETVTTTIPSNDQVDTGGGGGVNTGGGGVNTSSGGGVNTGGGGVNTGSGGGVNTGSGGGVNTGGGGGIDIGGGDIDTGGDDGTINASTLTSLYGDVLFVFQFTGQVPTFLALAQFSENNLLEDGGTVVLSTNKAILGIDEDADGENIAADGDQLMICLAVNEQFYYCLTADPNSTTAINFLFGPLSNGEATGVFTVCDFDTQTGEQCGQQLVNNPSGQLEFRVQPPNSALTASRMDSDAQSEYPGHFLTYMQQGTLPTGDGILDPAWPDLDIEALVRANTVLLNRLKSN